MSQGHNRVKSQLKTVTYFFLLIHPFKNILPIHCLAKFIIKLSSKNIVSDFSLPSVVTTQMKQHIKLYIFNYLIWKALNLRLMRKDMIRRVIRFCLESRCNIFSLFFVTPSRNIWCGCSGGKIKSIFLRVGRSSFIPWDRHEIKINTHQAGLKSCSLGPGEMQRGAISNFLGLHDLQSRSLLRVIIHTLELTTSYSFTLQLEPPQLHSLWSLS